MSARRRLLAIMTAAATVGPAAAYEPSTPNIGRPLEIPRACAAAAQFRGHAVIVGGQFKDRVLREAAAQDPTTWEWSPIAPLNIARAFFGLAEASGTLYAIGGEPDFGGKLLRSVERLDSLDGEWTAAPPLAHERGRHGVAVLNAVIFACGGMGDRRRVLNSCESLSPGTNEWRPAGFLPEPRWDFALAAIGDKLYAVGGSTVAWPWTPSDDLLVRDASGKWSRGAKLPKPLDLPTAAVLDGRLYATSGTGPGSRNNGDVYEYDPGLLRWRQAGSIAKRFGAASLAWQGQLYVLGGKLNDSAVLDAADVLDPKTGHVASLVSLPGAPDEDDGRIVENGLVRMKGRGARVKARRKERPDDVALAFGIERYRRAPTTRYAESDAVAFHEAAMSLGIAESRTRLIAGKEASLPGLRKYLEEWLPSITTAQSRVIVYFAGAGTVDVKNGRRYLLPWDGDPEFVDETAYSLEMLYAALRRLPARDILVVIDAGFSGTGERSFLPAGLRPLVPMRDDAPDQRISVLLAGGLHDAVGSSPALKGGAFTANLIDALDGRADADRDGALTLEEAFIYTRRKVREGSTQTPTLTTSQAASRLY